MLVSLFRLLKPSKFASHTQQKCICDIMGEPLMAVCNLQAPQQHNIKKSEWTGEVVWVRDWQKCVKHKVTWQIDMTQHRVMPLRVFLVTLFSFLHTRPAIKFHTVKLVCFQSPMWMEIKSTKCNNIKRCCVWPPNEAKALVNKVAPKAVQQQHTGVVCLCGHFLSLHKGREKQKKKGLYTLGAQPLCTKVRIFTWKSVLQ